MFRVRPVALLLFLVCSLPLFAITPKPCPAEFSIDAITAHDVQIGEPVTITWSTSGKPVIAQTIDISDVGYGTQLGADQRSFTYVPTKAGEIHVQVNASSGCDFVKAETKFHVRQCNVAPRALTVQDESVLPNGSFAVSVPLEKGESVRWEVRGGTIATNDGASIGIIAGPPGMLEIDAYVSKSSNCELKVSRSIPIVCPAEEIPMYLNNDEHGIAGFTFGAWIDWRPDQSVRWEVRGGTVLYTNDYSVGIQLDRPGTLEVDAYVTRYGFCETKISRSVPVICLEVPVYTSAEEVLAGTTFTAVAGYREGQSVRWEVRNGSVVSEGQWGDVIIAAGGPGAVEIDAYVTRGFCETKTTRTVTAYCQNRDVRMSVNSDAGGIAGQTFGAWIDYYADQQVRWEIRGGTILNTSHNSVSILLGGPGTLEIDTYVTRNGYCEQKISRSIPIVCYSDPTRVLTLQPGVARAGGSVLAFVNVFPWFNETVRYEVRNGTIESIDGLNVWIRAGVPGTLEVDAYITHGGCTFKVSNSMRVE